MHTNIFINTGVILSGREAERERRPVRDQSSIIAFERFILLDINLRRSSQQALLNGEARRVRKAAGVHDMAGRVGRTGRRSGIGYGLDWIGIGIGIGYEDEEVGTREKVTDAMQ